MILIIRLEIINMISSRCHIIHVKNKIVTTHWTKIGKYAKMYSSRGTLN